MTSPLPKIRQSRAKKNSDQHRARNASTRFARIIETGKHQLVKSDNPLENQNLSVLEQAQLARRLY